jgi:hypothetical protein
LVFAWRSPSVVAVTTWLVTLPLAYAVPRWSSIDPFTLRAIALPVGIGLALTACLLAVALWRSTDVLAGVAAGVLASWIVLALQTALHGTPFGFAGLQGDMGRMSANVTRYTATSSSADSWVPGLPAEYPPLYPWVTGKAGLLLGIAPWRLLADAEVLTISFAVVAAFVLWRRLVSAPVALAISALSVLTWGDPRKAHEIVTLAVALPWLILTFGRPPRGRLHWLIAGGIGGLLVVTYPGWLVYCTLAGAFLVITTWRAESRRRAFVLHLAGVFCVSVLLSCWYVVPFLAATFRLDGQPLIQFWVPPHLFMDMFPFMSMSPVGLLQLAGLVGVLMLRGRVWWASPMLVVVVGAFLCRVVGLISLAVRGQTMLMQYTPRLYGLALTISGVLYLAYLAPRAVRALALANARVGGAVTVAILVSWAAFGYLMAWMPGSGRAITNAYAARAHLEPMHDGTYPTFGPPAKRVSWFPVEPIRAAVASVRRGRAVGVTLSPDERLYSYLAWPGYMGTDRTSAHTLARWDDRRAEVRRIAGITDPAAFEAVSRATAFGPIDVFVLVRRNGRWCWLQTCFRPVQFDRAAWVIRDHLPQHVVVAIRKG